MSRPPCAAVQQGGAAVPVRPGLGAKDQRNAHAARQNGHVALRAALLQHYAQQKPLRQADGLPGKQLPGARFLGLDFTRKIKDWLYDISPLTDRFGNVHVAGNSSATEIQALGCLLQMKRLDGIIAQRREAAEYMNQVLSEEPGILVEKADTAETYGTHHLYLLRIDPEKVGGDIQQLSAKLAAKGLTNITHFGPMYRFNIMKQLGYDENAIAATCPVTERMFYKCYTHLPLYPLTREQLEYQAKAVVEAVREMKQGK
mgnify:CR=1 FL=1